MSDTEDVRRGQLAKQVIENEIYAESYDLIEKEIYRKWRDSRDEKEQMRLHDLLLALGKTRQVMDGVMFSGELALKKLQADRNRVQKIGDYFKSA
jgi:ribosome-binding ATPase YchF (GTP1/OBG family)